VQASFPLPPGFIQAQIQAVLSDIGAQAIKCGLLGRAEVVEAVAESLQGKSAPLILDPVLVNGAGALIVKPQTIETYRCLLLPRARVITPNLDEAQHLTGQAGQDEKAIRAMLAALHGMGAQMVIIKGGHRADGDEVLDWVSDGQRLERLRAPRLPLENPHGVGCTLSAAITASLAQGKDTWTAVYQAHTYLHRALQAALGWQVGAGRPPVNHHLGQAVYQP
jgi:hydroxymethylpyrimidine/phosphomethylpyrimidine kinase